MMEKKKRESWYERNEIKKVTLDWVNINCRITEREMELLQLIYDRKMIRRDHLEIISESYRNTGDNRTILLNRAIKKMFKQMLLDKTHEAKLIGKGNTPCIVSVDKGGSILLKVPHKRRIAHKTHIVNSNTYIRRVLPSNYKHINGVNQTEVDTILFCEETGNKIIMWRHEVPTKFIYNNQEVLFIPDAIFILEIGDKRFPIFLEYDTGSEGLREKEPKIIRNKILNYRKYKASNLWIEESWQSFLNKPTFPLLIFVTEDDKRIQFFNKKAKENGIFAYGVYHESYPTFIRKLATYL